MTIPNYGHIYNYKNAAIIPSKENDYHVLFRLTKAIETQGVNHVLWQTARLINLLKTYDISNKNIDIIVLISNKGFSSVLTDTAHRQYYQRDNPNTEIIETLIKYPVKFHLCAQTLATNQLIEEDINPLVKITLSAMLDIIEYSRQGYTIFE